jgi:hypothetical protein
MPFVLEHPNLDRTEENYLYFDPGDGRLIKKTWHKDGTKSVSSLENTLVKSGNRIQ